MTESPQYSAEECFLVLAPTGRDAALTCSLLHKAGIGARACRDVDELCAAWQANGALGLMIAEEALHVGAAKQVKLLLDKQEPWSDLPVLIFRGEQGGPVVRRPISQLVATLGNVCLLDRPLQQITMLSAANAARRSRNRQYTARAALQHEQLAVKQRDQFLAMLGHELRNPLAAISMASQMELDEDSVAYRGIIERQARHLTRLVDDLLDVSRVTSGKIVLQRSTLDLNEVITRALEAVQPTLLAQKLTVSVRASNGSVQVEADSVRLEQVVVNLLGNAAKYTPSAGQIEVTIDEQDGEAIIAVRDDGVGIAPDMLPRVFDLFAQAEGSLDRAKGGMGIGLTLVQNLVSLHGGSVRAESEGLGKGSTFIVRLPHAYRARPSQAPKPRHVPLAGGKRDVLIVEDNEDSRELLAAMLKRRGHRVAAAPDGLTGVEVALARQPEVVLVDIGLPGLDGYAVARRIRSALGGAVYLVALTGYGQPEDRQRALAAGFDVHLTKPVDLRVLQELLNAAGPHGQRRTSH